MIALTMTLVVRGNAIVVPRLGNDNAELRKPICTGLMGPCYAAACAVYINALAVRYSQWGGKLNGTP